MTQTVSLRAQFHRLLGRHRRQIESRSDTEIQRRADVFALTFRPGDRTATFYGKTLRPFGSAVGVVLAYGEEQSAMRLAGFRGRPATGGAVRYGTFGDRVFQYNVRRIARGGRGQLRIAENPSLAELTLRMDNVVTRRIDQRLSQLPLMPRVILGFPTDRLPQYEDTPSLRRYAARQIGVTLEHLNSNPPELVEHLIRGIWEAIVVEPGVDSNTGLHMVDAEICPEHCSPFQIFEDYAELVGDWTWNPVRELDLPRLPNPAYEILQRYGVDANGDFNQEIPTERLQAMVADFRAGLEPQLGPLDEEDVLDALVTPDEPVIAATAAVPLMRKQLTDYWNECANDQDLRLAARRPEEALFASGACRVQVLRRRNVGEPLRFTGEELGRRIEIDWSPINWAERT
jgi:hypothetical protein